jgi:hypothetical protein
MRFAFHPMLEVAFVPQSSQNCLDGARADLAGGWQLLINVHGGGLFEFPDDFEDLSFGFTETGQFFFGHRIYGQASTNVQVVKASTNLFAESPAPWLFCSSVPSSGSQQARHKPAEIDKPEAGRFNRDSLGIKRLRDISDFPHGNPGSGFLFGLFEQVFGYVVVGERPMENEQHELIVESSKMDAYSRGSLRFSMGWLGACYP